MLRSACASLLLIFSALLLTALVGACSRTAAPSNVPASSPEKLVALEREWSRAVIAGDRAATARLIADDYVGIDGRGEVSTKQAEIAEAANASAWKIVAEQLDDFVVRFYGITAVVTARNRETVKIDGKEMVVVFRRTTVWVRRDERWQCVSFHASRIAATEP